MKQKTLGSAQTTRMSDEAKSLKWASPSTFLVKPVELVSSGTCTKTAIKRADAKKPGISRLPHHTHVFPKDHPARGFSRPAG
ncbi:hypothetical protein ACW9HW_11670 [Pseudomonas sp. SDO5532_S415]|uniref:hypothetical protein n=1 Tax=Pseudomonas sp. Irchel 3A7 TaxID=2008913 RepID=UPI001140218E|nr:hypothetical protein [Pseudomonas sp. Irchel 3A7]